MSLIRLTEPGWEHYTGHFAGIDFEDGVATKEWPESFTDRIAASLRSEDSVTGEPLGIAHRMVSQRAIEMAIVPGLNGASAAEVVKANEASRLAQAAKPAEAVKEHTIDEIMAIADKDGITGLRKIADPLGIRGRSISDLVQAIVKHREAMKPTVAAAAIEKQPNEPTAPSVDTPAVADVEAQPAEAASDEEKAA